MIPFSQPPEKESDLIVVTLETSLHPQHTYTHMSVSPSIRGSFSHIEAKSYFLNKKPIFSLFKNTELGTALIWSLLFVGFNILVSYFSNT